MEQLSSSNTLKAPSAGSAGALAKLPKSFFIQTFGCQMNVADTERMESLLGGMGMESVPTALDADLVVINGCTVREKAVHKAVSLLGLIHHERKGGGKPILAMGGCVGQLEKSELFAKAPYLDFVFGTDAIDDLPELVYRSAQGERHFVQADFDRSRSYSTETKIYRPKAQAFVNIMKGCDKFCTYCIVPFTRGREKSRTIEEVVNDVAKLVHQGVREVTLLGQNVNSFGKGNVNIRGLEPKELHNQIGPVGPRAGEENFPQLLRALDVDPRLEKLKRIRFTSSHPLDFSDELIHCYSAPEAGGVRKLASQLHLPVQSGSNSILQKMGRHHRVEEYIDQMTTLRSLRPDVGLSTDLIVGFPGETEEDFQLTLKLLDTVQYDTLYVFAYSPRPGTKADKLEDDVPKDVKNRRLNAVLQHQLKISERRNAEKIGTEMELLIEGVAKHKKMSGAVANRVWTGRTECNRIVNFVDSSGRNLEGQFLKVRITSSTPLSLRGELLHEAFLAEKLA